MSEVTASTVYDVTASGGDLAALDATVTLSFAAGQDIEDLAGNALATTTPTGTNEPDFVVDNTAPTVASIARQSPSSSPTNADSLTWRVTFGEDVAGVDLADFTVGGTTATLTVSVVTASTVYDVTASGGDLAALDTTATLSFAAGQNVADLAGNALDGHRADGDERAGLRRGQHRADPVLGVGEWDLAGPDLRRGPRGGVESRQHRVHGEADPAGAGARGR